MRRFVVEVVEAVVVVVVDGSVVVVAVVVAVVGSVVGAVVGTVVAGAVVVVAGALVVGAEVAEVTLAEATCPTEALPYAAADPKSPTMRTTPIAVQKTAARVRLARRPAVGSTPEKVRSFALMESPTWSMIRGGRTARSPPRWPAKHVG